MNASRKMRRRAAAAGLCPNCRERPVDHVVQVDERRAAVACAECWPALVADLSAVGAHVSGCVGPCCAPGGESDGA